MTIALTLNKTFYNIHVYKFSLFTVHQCDNKLSDITTTSGMSKSYITRLANESYICRIINVDMYLAISFLV